MARGYFEAKADRCNFCGERKVELRKFHHRTVLCKGCAERNGYEWHNMEEGSLTAPEGDKMKKREMVKDELIEFKPKYKDAVYGVRNGSYRAYVWDLGREPKSWEGYRFTVSLTQSGEVVGSYRGAATLSRAIEIARQQVSGRAFRHSLRRMSGGA